MRQNQSWMIINKIQLASKNRDSELWILERINSKTGLL